VKKSKTSLLYIDKFSKINSNYYWLKYFNRIAPVHNLDVDTELNKKAFFNSMPVSHIHLGGSVKHDKVPLDWLKTAKKKFNPTITVFYGDAKPSDYHRTLTRVADKIYFSNKSYVKELNDELGIKLCSYMPCPTDPEVFKPYPLKKKYDVIFIGNNSPILGPERKELVQGLLLNGDFSFKIFGRGWANRTKPVYGEKFAKTCSSAKIAIGILDTKWRHLQAYFSNRLVFTMSSGCFYIAPYVPGLSQIFLKHRHLVWYKSFEELLDLIEYYLRVDKAREKIAKSGMEVVTRRFNFRKSVKKILGIERKKRK